MEERPVFQGPFVPSWMTVSRFLLSSGTRNSDTFQKITSNASLEPPRQPLSRQAHQVPPKLQPLEVFHSLEAWTRPAMTSLSWVASNHLHLSDFQSSSSLQTALSMERGWTHPLRNSPTLHNRVSISSAFVSERSVAVSAPIYWPLLFISFRWAYLPLQSILTWPLSSLAIDDTNPRWHHQ